MIARTLCWKGWFARRARNLERATGIALIDQDWRLALDRWPSQGCALLTRASGAGGAVGDSFRHGRRSLADDPADYQLDLLSRPARLHFETPPEPLKNLQRH